jgi:hypothetical protein
MNKIKFSSLQLMPRRHVQVLSRLHQNREISREIITWGGLRLSRVIFHCRVKSQLALQTGCFQPGRRVLRGVKRRMSSFPVGRQWIPGARIKLENQVQII